MIILCRIGETQALSNLIKSLVNSVYQEGGVIRQVKSLGDRIADKAYKAKDGSRNAVVRYMSVEFDANPDARIVAEKVARNNSEAMQVFVHKLKEKEYYKQIFDKDSWKQYEVNTDQTEFKNEMADLLAKEKINLGEEKFEKEFDRLKNKLI